MIIFHPNSWITLLARAAGSLVELKYPVPDCRWRGRGRGRSGVYFFFVCVCA